VVIFLRQFRLTNRTTMKHTVCPVTKSNTWKFPQGVTLTAYPQGGGHLIQHGQHGQGDICFPVRHTGDVFAACLKGGGVADIPKHCRAW
jgi:hypothetical protein